MGRPIVPSVPPMGGCSSAANVMSYDLHDGPWAVTVALRNVVMGWLRVWTGGGLGAGRPRPATRPAVTQPSSDPLDLRAYVSVLRISPNEALAPMFGRGFRTHAAIPGAQAFSTNLLAN